MTAEVLLGMIGLVTLLGIGIARGILDALAIKAQLDLDLSAVMASGQTCPMRWENRLSCIWRRDHVGCHEDKSGVRWWGQVLFDPAPGSLAQKYADVEKFAGIPDPAPVSPLGTTSTDEWARLNL